MIFGGLLVSAAAFAQSSDAPEAARKPAQRGPERAFFQAWDSADRDADGSISRSEFDAMPRVQNLPQDKRDRLFSRLDKNNDGSLSREEMPKPGNHPPHGPRPWPMQRLAQLDTDGTGGVSLEEFRAGSQAAKLPPERVEAIFRRLDRDGDGEITPKDRPEQPSRDRQGTMPGDGRAKATPRSRPDAERPFRQLDQDGDRSLSFEEFRRHPLVRDLDEDQQEQRFQALDTNNDALITPDEMRPLQQARGGGGSPEPRSGRRLRSE